MFHSHVSWPRSSPRFRWPAADRYALRVTVRVTSLDSEAMNALSFVVGAGEGPQYPDPAFSIQYAIISHSSEARQVKGIIPKYFLGQVTGGAGSGCLLFDLQQTPGCRASAPTESA